MADWLNRTEIAMVDFLKEITAKKEYSISFFRKESSTPPENEITPTGLVSCFRSIREGTDKRIYGTIMIIIPDTTKPGGLHLLNQIGADFWDSLELEELEGNYTQLEPIEMDLSGSFDEEEYSSVAFGYINFEVICFD